MQSRGSCARNGRRILPQSCGQEEINLTSCVMGEKSGDPDPVASVPPLASGFYYWGTQGSPKNANGAVWRLQSPNR